MPASKAWGSDSKGSLVSDESTSVRVGVDFGGTGVAGFSGELESSFFSSWKETVFDSFGGEENLGLRVVSSSEITVIVPELPTVVASPTSTVDARQIVDEVFESMVTSLGSSRLSIEKFSRSLPEELDALGVEPRAVNKPDGGSRGSDLASSIFARADADKSARAPVGLSLSITSGGSAPDAMVMNAWF